MDIDSNNTCRNNNSNNNWDSWMLYLSLSLSRSALVHETLKRSNGNWEGAEKGKKWQERDEARDQMDQNEPDRASLLGRSLKPVGIIHWLASFIHGKSALALVIQVTSFRISAFWFALLLVRSMNRRNSFPLAFGGTQMTSACQMGKCEWIS